MNESNSLSDINERTGLSHRRGLVFLYVCPKPVAVDATQSEKEPPMLVLSRHRDESIMIGDDVVVTIVDIRGDKVRLGIEAPNDIPVHRQEVYEAIKRENRKANQVQPSDVRASKENRS
ncbi:MAG: Carbon storage regulator [Planctomycetota bacterium]